MMADLLLYYLTCSVWLHLGARSVTWVQLAMSLIREVIVYGLAVKEHITHSNM